MKLLTVNHKDLQYEFHLLERTRIVQIIKENELTYLIDLKNTQSPKCNCPSGTFRGRCWHTTMIDYLLSQESIKEPWAEWSEEAGEMMYNRKEQKNV